MSRIFILSMPLQFFFSFYFALLQFCSPSIMFSWIWTAKLLFSVYFLMKALFCCLLHRRHHRGLFVIWLSTQYLNTDIKLKKICLKNIFSTLGISIEHNSGDDTEMRAFQIPSYPLSRNEWHKRGLPAHDHDSILNLCLFFFPHTSSVSNDPGYTICISHFVLWS